MFGLKTYSTSKTKNGWRNHGDVFFLWQINRLENIHLGHAVFFARLLEPVEKLKKTATFNKFDSVNFVEKNSLVEILANFEMSSAAGIDLVDGSRLNDVH